MKTHFAQIDRANESYNRDEYGTTLCGLKETESPVTDNIIHVSCIKCVFKYPKYKKSLKILS